MIILVGVNLHIHQQQEQGDWITHLGRWEKENIINLVNDILQPIRDKYGKPITVTSGFRSPSVNRLVGGSANSQHCKGEAADVKCEDNKELWDLIVNMIDNEEITVGQLIDEKKLSWIHISLPNEKRRNQILKL